MMQMNTINTRSKRNILLLLVISLVITGPSYGQRTGYYKNIPPEWAPCADMSKKATAKGRVWYVSGTGNDANSGSSVSQPFRSLQQAAAVVRPGDTVLIGNGIYTDTEKSENSAVVHIASSGRPDAWITWKARAGQHPEIRPAGWTGILISGSYHILEGLSVIGGNDSIYLLQAQEQAKIATPDPRFNTNGIFVNGRIRKPDEKPHHIIIRNCIVTKCPGGGATFIETDYIDIEDCKVSENAWYMRYGGSGITSLNNWAHDDLPGYHYIIRGNYVWNNKTMVPWTKIGKLSDGNGILLDVTDKSPGATNPNADSVIASANTAAAPAVKAAPRPERPEWKGRSLIANNFSAYNGGSGIHTFRTKHVDVINNTTYHNGQMVGYQEMFPNRSEDIVFLNNIIVPRPGGKVTSDNRNVNIKWDYNLYTADQRIFKGSHDIVADPSFIRTDLDPFRGDFRLKKGSPALNSGTSELPQSYDITGKNRPVAGRDRGCFEQ